MTNSEMPNSQSSNYFTPLEEMGVLQVVGDDAQTFLQNLVTNDVASLEINQAQRNGFCNAKGRLFAIFLLIRCSEGYQLILPRNMCDLLLQRLSMYVLRSKVSISNESDNFVCIGSSAADHLPSATNTVKHPNDDDRFLSICDQNSLEKLINEFKHQGLQLAPQHLWQQLEIEAGLAMIFPESKEKFTPQQVNLDLTGGVSFNKGCYPGQEVVARLHYLGKPSRRLFIAQASTNQLPNVADEVITEDGTVAGHIVSIQQIGQAVKILLSLKLSIADAPLLLHNNIIPIVQKLI